MNVTARAAAALLLAALAGAQDEAPAATDWAKDVARACTSPRYGLRLAAGKKIAAAGDAAVPAIRAFAQQNGGNAIPVTLVEALADGGGDGEATKALLVEWAQDREFYWRAQAMRGLVLRVRGGPLVEPAEKVFTAHLHDPAWLCRACAQAGMRRIRTLAQKPNGAAIDDGDPRAATRVATLDLPPDTRALLAALGDERTFLGDPWGKRRAFEAFQALQRSSGKDWGYRPEAGFAANATAIESMASDLHAAAPQHLVDPDIAFVGGVEILSCRNGDLVVRWTANGAVSGGTTPVHAKLLQLDVERWQALSATATALELPAQSGVVICDKMRIQLAADRAQAAVAPASLPGEAADWLKHLAAAIEVAGDTDLAAALRDRLQQFVVR